MYQIFFTILIVNVTDQDIFEDNHYKNLVPCLKPKICICYLTKVMPELKIHVIINKLEHQ